MWGVLEVPWWRRPWIFPSEATVPDFQWEVRPTGPRYAQSREVLQMNVSKKSHHSPSITAEMGPSVMWVNVFLDLYLICSLKKLKRNVTILYLSVLEKIHDCHLRFWLFHSNFSKHTLPYRTVFVLHCRYCRHAKFPSSRCLLPEHT
jgi:hypothetical protein